jgi:3-methylfumaryl-CoA hydratase
MVLTEEAAKHMSEPRSTDELQHGVVRRETCSLATVRRVAAMLDWTRITVEAIRHAVGNLSCLGPFEKVSNTWDGFAGLGVPLPDLGLPRLMLGGRTVRFEAIFELEGRFAGKARYRNFRRRKRAMAPGRS